MQKLLIFLYKFFFIGLLLQFFVQTFVTFGIEFTPPWLSYVRLWKEGLIGVFGLSGVAYILTYKKFSFLRKPVLIKRLSGGVLLLIAITSLIHFQIIGASVGAYAMAFKYDILGFVILLLGFHSTKWLTQEQKYDLIHRYGNVIKRTLALSLIRYFIVAIKPGTLKLFGFNNFVFEGTVGQMPPAVYYTHINYGLPRSQFLFERPITWGFFLTAFFPLFFVLFLHKRPFSRTRGRRVVYSLSIMLTFSRAARGSWFIVLLLIGLIFYTSSWKKFLFKIILPLTLLLGVVGYYGFDLIMDRSYSNTGHIAMIQQGIEMVIEKPVWGHGGATAGPGSHRQGEGFNPENQFLQIFIEFGAIGFLIWMSIYGLLMIAGFLNIQPIRTSPSNLENYQKSTPLFQAISLGMIGLFISGMVLHSFSDRMVVYPLMLIYGVILAYWGTTLESPREE